LIGTLLKSIYTNIPLSLLGYMMLVHTHC